MHRRQILHCNATNFVLLLLVTESFLQVYVFHYYDSFILQTLQFSSNKYLCLLGDSLAVSISFVLLLLVTESLLQVFIVSPLRNYVICVLPGGILSLHLGAAAHSLQLVRLAPTQDCSPETRTSHQLYKPKQSYGYGHNGMEFNSV